MLVNPRESERQRRAQPTRRRVCVCVCVYTRMYACARQRSPLSRRDCRAAPARVNANRNANESAPINACLISYSAASGRGKGMEVGWRERRER